MEQLVLFELYALSNANILYMPRSTKGLKGLKEPSQNYDQT